MPTDTGRGQAQRTVTVSSLVRCQGAGPYRCLTAARQSQARPSGTGYRTSQGSHHPKKIDNRKTRAAHGDVTLGIAKTLSGQVTDLSSAKATLDDTARVMFVTPWPSSRLRSSDWRPHQNHITISSAYGCRHRHPRAAESRPGRPERPTRGCTHCAWGALSERVAPCIVIPARPAPGSCGPACRPESPGWRGDTRPPRTPALGDADA